MMRHTLQQMILLLLYSMMRQTLQQMISLQLYSMMRQTPGLKFAWRSLTVQTLTACKSHGRTRMVIEAEWTAPGLKQYARRLIDGYAHKLGLVIADDGNNNLRGYLI